MSDDAQSWLMHWYLQQCDGDWEHRFGIKITTLDNPGWTLEIDLSDTQLDNRPFASVEHGTPSENLEGWRKTRSWWVASVEERTFKAACGPLDLSEVINIFRRWAEDN